MVSPPEGASFIRRSLGAGGGEDSGAGSHAEQSCRLAGTVRDAAMPDRLATGSDSFGPSYTAGTDMSVSVVPQKTRVSRLFLTFLSVAEGPGTKWPSAPARQPAIDPHAAQRARASHQGRRASADGAPGSVLVSGGDPSVAAGRAAAPAPGLGGRRAHNATVARAAATSTTSDVRTVRVPRSSGGWRARGGCPRVLDVLQTGLGL